MNKRIVGIKRKSKSIKRKSKFIKRKSKSIKRKSNSIKRKSKSIKRKSKSIKRKSIKDGMDESVGQKRRLESGEESVQKKPKIDPKIDPKIEGMEIENDEEVRDLFSKLSVGLESGEEFTNFYKQLNEKDKIIFNELDVEKKNALKEIIKKINNLQKYITNLEKDINNLKIHNKNIENGKLDEINKETVLRMNNEEIENKTQLLSDSEDKLKKLLKSKDNILDDISDDDSDDEI